MTNLLTKKIFLAKTLLLSILLTISHLAFAKSSGVVTFSTGVASITHADKSITPAIKNAELNSGDIIETRDGRVQLALIDGAKVSLQPYTIYKINKYEFSGIEDGSEYGFTELVKGGLRTISGLIGHKNRDRYQLKTAVATIGIRGTEFTVNFNSNNLLMTTNNGSVDVCNVAGCLNALSGQSIEVVGFGNAPKYTKKAASAAVAAPEPASFKAVFSTSDLINNAGIPSVVAANLPAMNANPTLPNLPNLPNLPILPALPTMFNGIGNATFIAINTNASVISNDTYNSNLTFDASGNLINVNNAIPIINITPIGFASFNNNDGIVAWGQASGGNFNAGANNFAIGKADYIAGAAPNPANIVNLTGNYNVFASTAPFIIASGVTLPIGSANSVTGSFGFNFTAGTYNYNLTVPTLSDTFNLTGSAIGLNVNNSSFESAGVITSTGASCLLSCTGALNTGKLIQGAFYGANAERVGLQYGINTIGLNGAIYGGAVLK